MTISGFEAELWGDGAALRQRLDLIENILESSHVVMFSRDPITMEMVYITPNAERILGYTAEEIVQVPGFWQAHIHLEDLAEYLRSVEAAIAAQAVQLECEYRFLHKAGEYRWLRAIAVFTYVAGRPANRIDYLTDITDRKLADVDIAFQASIPTHIHDGVIATDSQLRLAYINFAAERMYGIDALDGLGRPLNEFWANTWFDRADFEAAVNAVEATGSWYGRGPQTRLDGSRFPAAISMSRFKDSRGQMGGVICVIRDETEQVRLKNDLRESEENLRLLAEQAADGILLTVGPTIVFANPALLHLLNVSSLPELQGSSWLDFIHPEDRARVLARWSALSAGEPIGQVDGFRLVAMGGLSRMVEISVSHTTHHGQPAIVSTVRDITERRRGEEVRRLHDAALGAVGQAVFILDMNGTISYWNRFAENLYGWNEAEALGKTAVVFLPAIGEQARATEIIEGPLGGHSWSGEFPVRRKNGSTFEAMLTATPVHDVNGKQVGVVAVSFDLDNQKAFENALRQASQAKSDFLSRVSHELRTPLSVILGFNELLQLESLPAKATDYLQEVEKAGRQLLAIVDDVLDMSRIEAETMRLSIEATNAAEVVQEVANLMRPLATERALNFQAEFDSQPPCHVSADRQRLIQVLMNLVSNGIKYNRPGGRVRLAFEIRPPNRIRFLVEDTGIGIAVEQQPRLFSPFERLDAGTSSIPGTGLGLALSKRLSEMMGGVIGVESSPGKGSTFWIEFDEVESARAGHQSYPPSSQFRSDQSRSDTVSRPELTVVYIEDDLAHRALVEGLLSRRSSVRLLPAIQGRIGLQLVHQHQPDLVLLDMHLPDMSGEEVLAALRADPATAAIPVVVLSADATPRHVRQVEAMGVRAYLTKPIDVPRFLAIVDEVRASLNNA